MSVFWNGSIRTMHLVLGRSLGFQQQLYINKWAIWSRIENRGIEGNQASLHLRIECGLTEHLYFVLYIFTMGSPDLSDLALWQKRVGIWVAVIIYAFEKIYVNAYDKEKDWRIHERQSFLLMKTLCNCHSQIKALSLYLENSAPFSYNVRWCSRHHQFQRYRHLRRLTKTKHDGNKDAIQTLHFPSLLHTTQHCRLTEGAQTDLS
jgi:hypothetical protein